MGWFSDIYDSVKQSVTNVWDTVKQTTSNWLQGKYLAPGYNYCGPGNPLDNGEPVNESDSHCRQHDQDYDNLAQMKNQGKVGSNELKQLIRESDDRLINNLQRSQNRDLGSYLSEYGIRSKKALENWGILDPEKFVK